MPDALPTVQAQNPDLTGSISGWLGIQQKQQALQTGAIQQQAAQAESQQAQQKNAELQKAQQIALNPVTDADGNLDRAKTADYISRLGPYAQEMASSYLSQANEVVNNKKAIQALTVDQKKEISQTLGSLASDPTVDAGKVADAVERLRAAHPNDASFSRLLTSATMHMPSMANPKQLQQTLGQYAQSLGGPSAQTPSTIDKGGQIQPGVTNTNTGAFTPAGSAITKTTAPENTIGPGGQIIHIPAGGAGLPSTTAGSTSQQVPPGKLQALKRPGVNAPRADQDAYNSQIAAANQEVSGARTAANDTINGVQATRFRNQQIIDLIPHANTGPGMRMLNTLASRLPGSTGDAYQDLEHYTAQNSAALAQKMGVPHTNLGAETAGAAAGNVDRNPGALKEITKTNDALNTAFDLYNRGLQKLTDNGNDFSKVNAYKQEFGSTLDINAIRWADAHRRGDKEEIDLLTQKLGKEGIAEAQKKLKTLKTLADTGDLP
jgi:hypothetical protein